MTRSAPVRALAQHWWATGRGWCRRTGLSARALVGLVLGVGVLGAAVLSFGALYDDVSEHNGLAGADRSNLHFFIRHRTAQLVQDARWVTTLGSVEVLGVLAVVVAALLWLRGARLLVAVAPGLAFGAAGACVGIAKASVGRARPPVSLHRVTEAGASFPSGHATDSTAFYLTLALVVATVVFQRPIARIATVAAATVLCAVVGASRVLLGVHWPTDVLAGWTLGVAAASTMALFTLLFIRFVHPDGPPPEHRMGRLAHRLARLACLSRQPRHSVS